MDDFEVLLANDGSTQNITEVVEPFKPYLNITLYDMERTQWRSCPSKAFKHMLKFALREVITVAHPEIMIPETALQHIYDSLTGPQVESNNYCRMSRTDPTGSFYISENDVNWNENKRRWVSLKAMWIENTYWQINGNNWHQAIDNLQNIPGFWQDGGFCGQLNRWHMNREVFAWWLCGATFRNDPIWEATRETETHGVIDMDWIHYRMANDYIDIVPKDIVCYHQAHLKTAPLCAESNA